LFVATAISPTLISDQDQSADTDVFAVSPEEKRESPPTGAGSIFDSLTIGDVESQGRATTAFLPAPPAPAGQQFRLLQQWEGVVTSELFDGEFSATLRDLTSPSFPEEQGIFSIDQVSSPDHRLVLPGAVFYWSIGYEDTPSGTRRTISMLRFRRLPAWSRGDMRRIARDVERYQRLFSDDQQRS